MFLVFCFIFKCSFNSKSGVFGFFGPFFVTLRRAVFGTRSSTPYFWGKPSILRLPHGWFGACNTESGMWQAA